MIKIFFATFFIAELIIAGAIIFNIYKLNKFINKLNLIFSCCKNDLKEIIILIRTLLECFAEKIEEFHGKIQSKKEEYMIKALKNVLIYISILSIKGRYKNAILAYQLGSEIYEGIKESEF